MTAPEVLDRTRARALPTSRVVVTAPLGVTDAGLAAAAGYDPQRHYGYAVHRDDLDGVATVALHND